MALYLGGIERRYCREDAFRLVYEGLGELSQNVILSQISEGTIHIGLISCSHMCPQTMTLILSVHLHHTPHFLNRNKNEGLLFTILEWIPRRECLEQGAGQKVRDKDFLLFYDNLMVIIVQRRTFWGVMLALGVLGRLPLK